ncbi:hypothetical protein [Kribbella endophytica]
MGVDVILVRRGAKRSKTAWSVEELVSDSRDVFSNACVASGTPMLGRVKPYGSLVLTSDEMAQFIDEVERVHHLVPATDRGIFEDVVRVAKRCEADRATELHLEGD